jgi:hypothetical protein
MIATRIATPCSEPMPLTPGPEAILRGDTWTRILLVRRPSGRLA